MTEPDLKQIGKRICERRQRMGITQEKLAEQMDVSVQMVSNLERGNKAIRITNLIKLTSILDVSADYILTGNRVYNDKTLSEKASCLDQQDRLLVEALIDRLLTDSNG